MIFHRYRILTFLSVAEKIHIVAAILLLSSLYILKRNQKKKQSEGVVTAFPGLSLNNNSLNQDKSFNEN